MDVDRPIEDLGLVLAVDRVEELVAGQDAAVALEEGDEEPELDGGQRHEPIGDPDLVALAIDDEVAVPDRLAGARRCAPPPRPAAGPLEDPLDAEDELGRGERLREVVVGAGTEARDPVVRQAPRREDDHRRLVGPPDGPQDREAVDLRAA